MSTPIITVEHLSKRYHLGQIGAKTLRESVERFRTRTRLRRTMGNRSQTIDPQSITSNSDDTSDLWALKDVSFEVQPGDVLGIIGRNGAGKSTLLKILSRITEPTSGRAIIRGRVSSLLEVGTGFHPELTGRENVFLNGAILGMKKTEVAEKFDEIVAFSEVERFIDTPVKHYSSGMHVRLAFAVAAHLEPDVLIVDEVLAVGDASFQKKCLGKMGSVAKQGRTILFVSHNMSAVRSLCGWGLMLKHGRIVFTGSTPQVIDQYLAEVNEVYSCDFDLNNIGREKHYGSRLRLLRLRFNHGDGIWHNRVLKAEIDFESLEDVADVSFGIGFCNRDGARIVTIDSDGRGKRLNIKRGQKGSASFLIPEFSLAPDTYTLDVGSRSGDNYGLDYLTNCGQVFVMPSEATASAAYLRQSVAGGYRPITEWKVAFQNGESCPKMTLQHDIPRL